MLSFSAADFNWEIGWMMKDRLSRAGVSAARNGLSRFADFRAYNGFDGKGFR
jgi:hypothetical protein